MNGVATSPPTSLLRGRTTPLSLSSNTTLTVDPSFDVAILSGETWGIEMFLFVDQTTANASFSCKIDTPSLTFGNKDVLYTNHASGITTGAPFDSGIAFTDNVTSQGATQQKFALHVNGTFKASADGTLRVKFAQLSSHADPTTVIGWLNATKIG